VADFSASLPEAVVYVLDNASTDRTAEVARASGAKVILESRQGKGYAVQTLFEQVDADYYIIVDGDDTYPASDAPALLREAVGGGFDMVVGSRLERHSSLAFRPLHHFGNRLIRFIINNLFHVSLKDILSGYRVLSRQFVKGIPVLAVGFEIEAEMTLKALYYGYSIREIDIHYGERPEGSFSKLHTFKDGLKVLTVIFMIFRDYRPLLFFFFIGTILLLFGLVCGGIVIQEYVEARYIRRVPLAVLSASTVVAALLNYFTGLILDSLSRRFKEVVVLEKKRLGREL
jgi:glycosyltransferase involved in cell wall biosynthesis